MATWDSRANELFLSALDRPPADRAAFLDSSCADDPVVRARVEAMLVAEEHARDFLARPAVAWPIADERPGATQLGPYKLLQKLGEGGMGTVWMAEQAEPVRRTVAVKVIRGGPASDQVAVRFEAERQALALMDHPNIAKVFDAGSTPDGRLFLVMELLKGVPITTFCDERRLSVRDRLELFVYVCRAVQHAHQKGIIHRDIKPSNVLVALYDSRPVPKVIDFGLAKATGQRLTDKTLFTEFGTVVGTLEYMSPEQAELNQLDVDTRTDVYSLGVLLYELLTGTTPLDPPRLGPVPILEVLRQVREGDTPRPSTRLSTSLALPTIAAARGVDPRHLAGLLKGELDWIAMTALEKDRERRYESAAALAADVERYLRDEAVQACPPSVWYRVRKFARRYRRGLVAAGVVGLALVLAMGAVAGSIGWAIRDAESRRAKALDDARAAAAGELDMADLLLNERKRPEAEAAWGRAARHLDAAPDDALSARLAETRHRLDAAARDDEFVAGYEALLLATNPRADSRDEQLRPVLDPDGKRERDLLARYGLGPDTDPAAAAELIQSRPTEVRWYLTGALYKCAAYAGSERPHDPRLVRWYARVLDAIDPNPWRAALRATFVRDDAAELEKLAREVDPRQHHPAVLLVAVARTYRVTPRGALELLRRAQAAHPGDVWLNTVLGFLLAHHKAPAQAIPFLTAALALRPHNPVLLLSRASAFREVARRDEALADAVAATKVDPQYLLAHVLHADLLLARGDTTGGEAAARRALAINPRSPTANHVLGNARRNANDPDGALAAYRTAIATDPKFVAGHTSVGLALLDKEDVDGAIKAFRTATRLDAKHIPARFELGVALWKHKKDGAGAALALLEALAIDPHHADARAQLVRLFIATKASEAAVAVAREGVERRPTAAAARGDLGLALHEAGDHAAALDAFRMAVALDPNSADAHSNLGTAYGRKKEYQAAADCFRRATEIEPTRATAWHNLGLALRELKEWDGAAAAFRKEVALGPKSAKLHFTLAAALTRSGDTAGAGVEFREAARLEPEYLSAWSNAGASFYQAGRWRDARDAWAEAVRAFPTDYASHYRLGVFSAVGPDPELHDPRTAGDAGQKLIDAGQTGTGWMLVAWAEYRKGQWKAAVAAIEKSLGPNPPADRLTPLRGYLLAMAHARLGDKDEARRWYDKAVAAKPDPIPEAVARARAEATELLGIDPPKK